jgi:hypothetical protein
MKKPFKLWLNELWLQNCEERMLYKECTYKMQDYFSKYKWWLKREYKHQMRNL